MYSRILGVVLFALCASVLHADVITFDNVTTDSQAPIWDGYGGLNWSNMYVLNSSTYSLANSGYKNGTVSGDYVAFNAYAEVATVADSIFNFDGAYLTGAWNNGLNVEVRGYRGADLLYDRTVEVNYSGPTWFDFDYVGVDRLVFSSFGGTDADSNDGGGGTHFAMDNFTINSAPAVPAPGAALLIGLGLSLVGWLKRRMA